jgi:predicted transposase YdaD
MGLFRRYYKSSKRKIKKYGVKKGEKEGRLFLIETELKTYEDTIKRYPQSEKAFSKRINQLNLEKEELEKLIKE